MITKELRLYRCWVEEFEVQENIHTRSTTHTRETSLDYDGTSHGGNAGPGETGPGKGGGKKGKGKNGKGPKKTDEEKPEKPKKEKTEDQLARAVTQCYFSSIIFDNQYIYIY